MACHACLFHFPLELLKAWAHFVSVCCASREALRWTIFSMQATGHILLGSSCYIEQLLEEEERAEKSLALPQESRIRQLQSMLLGKISHWWWTRAHHGGANTLSTLRCRWSQMKPVLPVQFADISTVSQSLSCSVTFFFLPHMYVEADTTSYSSESTFTHYCIFYLQRWINKTNTFFFIPLFLKVHIQ